MRKIRKNDTVKIMVGKDKGSIGKVLSVIDTGYSIRVKVEGKNLVKKHVKRNPNADEAGGIKIVEAAIDMSNVAIYNSATQKHDKVKFAVNAEGKKYRVYKSTGEVINE